VIVAKDHGEISTSSHPRRNRRSVDSDGDDLVFLHSERHTLKLKRINTAVVYYVCR